MPTCPNGHDSADADYCDTCGAAIGGAAAPAGTDGAAEEPAAQACPQCGAVRTGRFCEADGYDFVAADLRGDRPAPADRGTGGAPTRSSTVDGGGVDGGGSDGSVGDAGTGSGAARADDGAAGTGADDGADPGTAGTSGDGPAAGTDAGADRGTDTGAGGATNADGGTDTGAAGATNAGGGTDSGGGDVGGTAAAGAGGGTDAGGATLAGGTATAGAGGISTSGGATDAGGTATGGAGASNAGGATIAGGASDAGTASNAGRGDGAASGGGGAGRAGWRLAVRADHEYHLRVLAMNGPDAEQMEFPKFAPERQFALQDDQVLVGRASRSRGIDPQIDLTGPPEDPGVSRSHAMLVRGEDGGWSVVDLDSANGTYLNGSDQPIAANRPVRLRDGDRIHVGAWTTLQLHNA